MFAIIDMDGRILVTDSTKHRPEGCQCSILLDVKQRLQDLPQNWESGHCITWEEVWHRKADQKDYRVIDIRDEIRNEKVQGASHLPMGTFLGLMYKRSLIKENEEMAVFCNTDTRSAMAVAMCRALGYSRIRKINGGYVEYRRLLSSGYGIISC